MDDSSRRNGEADKARKEEEKERCKSNVRRTRVAQKISGIQTGRGPGERTIGDKNTQAKARRASQSQGPKKKRLEVRVASHGPCWQSKLADSRHRTGTRNPVTFDQGAAPSRPESAIVSQTRAGHWPTGTQARSKCRGGAMQRSGGGTPAGPMVPNEDGERRSAHFHPFPPLRARQWVRLCGFFSSCC